MLSVGVAVLVSGGGTNLQAIIDASLAGKLPHADIRLVVSNRADAYALQRARDAKLRTSVIGYNGDGSDFEERLYRELVEHGIKLAVLAGFMKILSPSFIKRCDALDIVIINVHPSLIPAFCGRGYYGLRVHEAALERGTLVTGATVHIVNEVPDGGRILLQKAVRAYPNDTPQRLQKRVMKQAEWVILPRAIESVCAEICCRSEI